MQPVPLDWCPDLVSRRAVLPSAAHLHTNTTHTIEQSSMLSMRHFVLTVLALVMLQRAVCDPAFRGTRDPQRDQRALEGGDKSNVMDTNATTTGRGLQQTIIQSFIDSYQSRAAFNNTTPTGVTGPVTHRPQNQPQIATSPNVGGGPGVVFGGGAQPGAPGIAGTTPLTPGGPSGFEAGGAGIGSRRALKEIEKAKDIPVEGIKSIKNGTTERELQQTTLQAFINSYAVGNRFNDTGLTGITGPTTHQPQVAHSPVVSGVGVLFGGGAQAGAPGIAGGTFPTLAGQPGVGAGGAGIGSSSTGLGTTAGSIGGAPGGAGFIGPSGLPAPVDAQGGIGSSGGLGSVGGGGGAGGI